jgi:hypothetical protein
LTDDPRSVSDAAFLTEETDASLRAMVEAPVGDVSETTRVLARFELEARGHRGSDWSEDDPNDGLAEEFALGAFYGRANPEPSQGGRGNG